MFYSVAGSNFGDEGKGLAVDFLAARSDGALVVRHNGGAQSGHTVEINDKRFVFHELSSGSFRRADTYWAQTFLPDLYKLEEEISSFTRLCGFAPRIFASPRANITTVDDVLLNMLLEDLRGENRHGSCGMGINEADLRGKAGFGISVGALCSLSAQSLCAELQRIRREYVPRRLESAAVPASCGSEYLSLLRDDNVLANFADRVIKNLHYVTPAEDPAALIGNYADVIFEGGQGLRLDAQFRESYPHVTASRTGLANVAALCGAWGTALDEAVYVTRSYLTKHGAGPLKNEIPAGALYAHEPDRTNLINHWQGGIRYARHESVETLLAPIRADLDRFARPRRASMFITHLNETDGRLLFRDGDLAAEDFLACAGVRELFGTAYLSSSRESSRTRICRLQPSPPAN